MKTKTQEKMNRAEFGNKIRRHDWFTAYSDDQRVWRAGIAAERALRMQHEKLECPYDMSKLRMWAHNMILEDFAEEAPGQWFRQPRKYKHVAPTSKDDLISREKHDEITRWMTLGATSSQIDSIVR
tara:strand:+ start:163 stop:540 length:378 start_codon:yes stop_codon:yes gene_type:complete